MMPTGAVTVSFIQTSPGVRYGFTRGLLRGTQWRVGAQACESPTCGCLILDLRFRPACAEPESEDGTHRISLDLATRSIHSATIAEEREFAEAFLDDLDPIEDWLHLGGIFTAIKARLYDNTNLTELDVDFDFEQIEYDGLLVGYNDILPFHDRLDFEVDGHDYTVADLHCLLPHCLCEEAHAVFCAGSRCWPQGPLTAHEQFTVTMDLKSRRWAIKETLVRPMLPVAAIVEAFVTRFNAYRLLKQRRATLRALYVHNRHKFEPEPREPVRAPTKVGRNDQCPCGSGKKYKRCCGR